MVKLVTVAAWEGKRVAPSVENNAMANVDISNWSNMRYQSAKTAVSPQMPEIGNLGNFCLHRRERLSRHARKLSCDNLCSCCGIVASLTQTQSTRAKFQIIINPANRCVLEGIGDDIILHQHNVAQSDREKRLNLNANINLGKIPYQRRVRVVLAMKWKYQREVKRRGGGMVKFQIKSLPESTRTMPAYLHYRVYRSTGATALLRVWGGIYFAVKPTFGNQSSKRYTLWSGQWLLLGSAVTNSEICSAPSAVYQYQNIIFYVLGNAELAIIFHCGSICFALSLAW